MSENVTAERFEEHEAEEFNRYKRIEERLDAGEVQMDEHHKTLTRIDTTTAEMLEIFKAGKGFFKVMGWLGTGAKWVAFTSAAVGAIWAWITHGGHLPK